jgi:hypothetical protein
MKRPYLISACAIAAFFGTQAMAEAAQPLKRDLRGIALGMTIKDTEKIELKNCLAGSLVSIYCNDGQFSIRVSDKGRIYEITINPCTIYTCKDTDRQALVKQIEGEYGVKLEDTMKQSYYGKRPDMIVGLSTGGDLWHIGIVDQQIQMDDSSLK